MEYKKMVFDKTNAYMLNSKELSMHDDWLEAFEYDMNNRRATLTVEVDYEWHDGNGNIIKSRDDFKKICGVDTQYIKMIMSDVAALDVTSLELWGNGRHVSSVSYVEPHESVLGARTLGEFHKKRELQIIGRNEDGKWISMPKSDLDLTVGSHGTNPNNKFTFNDLIEIKVCLNSGDELNFLCRQIEFANDPDYKKSEE
ncbi:MAG: hypothetical protein IJQ37_04595 [Clostridia bacterium]|nr:hypothetical protein [Clostridia bacterium]